MALKTAFDGASDNFRLERKGLLSGDANSLAARELRHLQNRSHHLIRNNPAAVTARNRLVAHWIGNGLKVKWDDKKMQSAWDAFIKDPSIDGHGTFANMQNLIGSAYFESGEVFARMMIQRRDDCPIPLKLQVIEAEQLDPLYVRPKNIRYGIEFNSFGKPTNYHFWNRHPNSLLDTSIVLQREPISADDILHVFLRERPGQWRGIPKLAPALLSIYEMDELTDATLVRQKAAQAIGWIIKKNSSGALPLLGTIENAQTQDQESIGKKLQKILPGGIHYLAEDEDFQFAAVEDIGSNLVTMLEHNWRLIASCLDVTYEQLTGDLTKVNFSSIRAGLIEFRRRVAMTQQLIFINLFIVPLCKRFQELAKIYISANAASSGFKVVLPKTDWVDPLKDAQADIAEIRAGLATLEDKLAERGVEDIATHLAQLAKEQGYDVVLDSNPVHNTQGNTTVTDQQPSDQQTQQTATQQQGN